MTIWQFSALFTEHEPPEFVTKLLHFFGIVRLAEAMSKFKECFLLLFLRLNALFNEFYKHAIVTQATVLGNRINLICNFSGKSHASPNLLCYWNFCRCHMTPLYTIVVQVCNCTDYVSGVWRNGISSMKTIRVVLDEKMDMAARPTSRNRAALVRDALREHLQTLEVRSMEKRDREGYAPIPQARNEAFLLELEAIWPEEAK